MTAPGQFQIPKTSGDRPSGSSGEPVHRVHDLGLDRDRTRTGARLFHEAYLLLSLTSLFWSGNVVLGRFVAAYIPPIMLSVIRWGGAFVVLLPFAARHLARDWPLIRQHFGLLTLLALTGFSAYNTMAYYGLHFTTAINGLLLQSVAPLFVAVWSFVLFRDRLSLRQAAGITISMTGALVIVGRGDLGVLARLEFNVGDLMILGTLVFYALYTALLRVRPAMHPLAFLASIIAASAALMVLPAGLEVATGHVPALTPGTFAAFGYLAIFPSVLAYL